MLSNQPQGGFLMRRPTVVASGNYWGNDGFGFFFQRNPDPQAGNMGRPLFQPNWNSQTGNTRQRGQYYNQVQRGWW